MKIRANSGFTLVELLVAIALGLVILAGLYQTFKTQHDSYIVQDQVAAMQQNLRAAMYMITRDLQMAGWYTNFDRNDRTINLGEDLGERTGKPLFFAEDNSPGGADGTIKEDTDVLAIVRAAEGTGEEINVSATASGSSIPSSILNLTDLDSDNKKFGLLVKSDLRTADFFELNSSGEPEWALNEYYTLGDLVFRADIIIYKIEEDGGRPMLKRKNLGNDNGYQVVAENVENMQVMYHLQNDPVPRHGDEIDNTNQDRIRAVEVILVARTAHIQRGYTDTNTYSFANNTGTHLNPNDNYRRKVFSTIVKTRNVGL